MDVVWEDIPEATCIVLGPDTVKDSCRDADEDLEAHSDYDIIVRKPSDL